MRDSWLELTDRVLRPARPRLEQCLRERELHRARQRLASEARARAIADCRDRIERERAAVFAADDGVVSSRMTELEREWRTVSRRDPDCGLMDLWARIAPVSWLDRKRWRDSDPAMGLDAAVALSADVEGVEAAESAMGSLRIALAAWGTELGSKIRWRLPGTDADCASELLARPQRVALQAIAGWDAESVVFERTEQLRRAVLEAMLVRLPDRPLLGQAIARAASVDGLLRAAMLVDRPNPVTPLRALWRAGYALAAADATGVTLELPRI